MNMLKLSVLSACILLSIGASSVAIAASAVESRTIVAEHGSKDLNESWQIGADARVEITNVSGTLAVAGWDKAEAALTGSLGADSKLEISGDSQRLVLKVEGSKNGWFGNGPHHDSDLVLHVPRAAVLDLNVVSADMTVSGVAGKSLQANSVSGGLKLNSGAPDLEANSVSGDIVYETQPNTTTTRAHLQTVSGNIDAKGLGGRVKLETVSGDITFAGGEVQELESGTVSGNVQIHATPAAHARMHLDSMSGDIHVRLPASVSAHIEASSFSGGIHSDFGKVIDKEMGPGSSLDANVGNGDAKIDAQSFSGSIEVRKQ